MTLLRAITATCLLAAFPAWAKLSPEQLKQLPAPAAKKIDFAKDIKPILEVSCAQCHGRGKDKGGFSIETRELFLKGGDTGAAVVPGKSAESYAVEMISGMNPDIIMPAKGKKLTPEQVAIFRAWIDQGVQWPKEINFAKHEPANLKPEVVKAPAPKSGLENPVDGFIDKYFAKNKVKWGKSVDDAAYARRVYLDIIGLLPTPAELDAFVTDKTSGKREALVKRLLADNQRYAEHWLTFWNDMLRNDYRGTGYIDGGRKQITGWLYGALASNTPYDQFVAGLVNPTPEAEGFTKGIVWRGVVNASMLPPIQAAQSISQVFMGVNLKCASCHDSFINEYTLKDAYGLAGIFADAPLELVECDKPTGHMSNVKFLYSELGAIDGKADKSTRMKQLADVMTGKNNGRISRTIVNRLWQRFIGYGLVEPVDEMDHPAWNQELLDWLAEDLVAHNYDLKHTMARILTSRAYQQPSVNLGEKVENYVFRGPAVRRLSAEQFCDALMTLGGMNYPKADAPINRQALLGGASAKPTGLALEPKWIWNSPKGIANAPAETVYFRHIVNLPAAPTEAHITVSVDNSYILFINGKRAGAGKEFTTPDVIDASKLLKVGDNVIALTAVNNLPSGRPPRNPEEVVSGTENPAGVLLYARVRAKDKVMDFVSDATWVASTKAGAGWNTEKFAGKWENASALGDADVAPWKLKKTFMATAASVRDTLPVRASLVAADPLMTALGRPNREQVTTVRQATATTLQALELTNGGTLSTLLKQGAQKVLAAKPANTRDLVEALYYQAIGRKPSASERQVAEQIVGSPATVEGVEDMLWALAMLPEFQLIY